ncbi:Na+/H+ antiporter NhaA [Actinoplanes sp. DH11]|uniref:Na+/H+ antiporter NhaA n=1 Tax=Actinoplanes sp. DH11 TaxID=2857011 RepID=UPI001E34451E|nr:Na+/H+ antiporter NhaA [Actinoplanes sp. DH11]
MNDRTINAFGSLSPGGRRNFTDTLRAENAGAILLAIGTVLALIWANSPWRDSYTDLSNTVVGPASLHLNLSVANWATDGLLTIFFFVVGLELKREFVTGQLRNPATAAVPIVAAVGGMITPAAVYALVNLAHGGPSMGGWAIPVATDIAFAVAVLTLFGRRLPIALRAFLLTLAVVDDLLGIVVIAVLYADGLAFGWLGAALLTIGVLAGLTRRHVTAWILVPLAVLAWAFMHLSGVHATIAGVLIGFTVPALARDGQDRSVAERWEHRWRPVSAGLAVPVFALFAAGVSLSPDALATTLTEPAAQGVILGLVAGKPLGIMLATFALVTLTRAALDQRVTWLDLLAVAVVSGIGFTVALLIGELSFAPGTPQSEPVKAGILIGSLASAMIGGLLLTWRSRAHQRRRRASGQGTAGRQAGERPGAA